MAYNIGPKIGIDGEAEFRRQISQINTEYKTLVAQTKAVTAEFDKKMVMSKASSAQLRPSCKSRSTISAPRSPCWKVRGEGKNQIWR